MSIRKRLLGATATLLAIGAMGLATPPSATAANVKPATTPTMKIAVDGEVVQSVPMSPDGVTSAESCSSKMCLFVNGTGLKVNYAVVTNWGGKFERPFISSTNDGITHTGPRISNGTSWRHDYNKNMRDGDKVCGSMEGLGVACVWIEA